MITDFIFNGKRYIEVPEEVNIEIIREEIVERQERKRKYLARTDVEKAYDAYLATWDGIQCDPKAFNEYYKIKQAAEQKENEKE